MCFKRIRCSKYKQGIVKVIISCQMQNLLCSIFKIATCEAFLIITKIWNFSKKLENYASHKNPMNQNILFPYFTPLPNFRAFRSNNKIFSKTESVPLREVALSPPQASVNRGSRPNYRQVTYRSTMPLQVQSHLWHWGFYRYLVRASARQQPHLYKG